MQRIHPYQTHFNIICELAREQNEEALLAYLFEHELSISMLVGSRPVELLAREGNHEAVNFLLNKLPDGLQANRDHAVKGYAQAGAYTQVEVLLEEGANIDEAILGYAEVGLTTQVEYLLERGADINYALHGYARGKRHSQVDDLIKRGAQSGYAVEGYAEAGLIEKVNDLCDFEGGIHYPLLYPVRCALRGYARAGFISKVNDLQEMIGDDGLHNVIEGYAEGCFIEQVNELCASAWESCDSYAVYSYARAGFIREVETLLMRGADPSDAVEGLLKAGIFHYVEDLLADGMISSNHVMIALAILATEMNSDVLVEEFLAEGENIDSAAYGYAYKLNMKRVNELLDRGADHNAVVDGFAAGGYIFKRPEFIRIASQINHYDCRQAIIKRIKELAPFFDLDGAAHKAARINHFMCEYNLDYSKACALENSGTGTSAWLLQGMQATIKGAESAKQLTNTGKRKQNENSHDRLPKLPKLVFDHINSFVLGVADVDADKIRQALSFNLVKDAKATNKARRKGGLLNRRECKAADDRAQLRHNARMKI